MEPRISEEVQPERRYTKGNIVLFQGEVPRFGFVVNEGCLKVYAIDNDGNEKVVGICSKNDIFPADWLLGHSRSVMFYYETLDNTVLTPFKKSDCQRSGRLMDHLQEYISTESSSSLLRNLALQQSSATSKILYFFYYLAVRHGQENTAGLYSLGLPLTHQFIADNLGLTRETVAGEVSKLKKAGVVVYRHKRYLVDKSLLVRTVGKEITNNFVAS